jgi:hypothetical protein
MGLVQGFLLALSVLMLLFNKIGDKEDKNTKIIV